MKKILIMAVAALMLFSLSGCSKKAGDAGNKLLVWSFTDELDQMLGYYKKDHPDVSIS
jgi:ABC-type glycerol-3-phosphate transport system substrate-binding protein